MKPVREPIFNIPPVVLGLLGVFALVYLTTLLWSPDDESGRLFLYLFSFIPARYDTTLLSYPGGFPAEIWTFASYAFIHANSAHLIFNSIWFVAFGTPVARRFGARRFLIFFVLTAAAGAAAHLATHVGDPAPVVGASAAISGAMAAAIRFVFQAGGPLGLLRRGDEEAYRVPAVSLRDNLRDPRVLAFLAAWFGTNLLFGVGGIGLGSTDQTVAWEAHIGGFLAGLIAFPLFDPIAADHARPPQERPVESSLEE